MKINVDFELDWVDARKGGRFEMEQNRQMFLQSLYFKLFELYAKEKKLMNNHDFDSDNECVRNDQSISGVREETKTMQDLISKYLILEG